ncbi:fibronectin type III domain-containing protein [uncultured Bacteroides sp.]|uniref:fibronectin type III domain-containing protein n=1 Tax=uncultured Bacteroides sp. TaxID=162156 RepID=UPI002AA9631B|nr:fibronectin type III domain-containing protein [uncultured Bacteroides sp.]
MNKILRNFTYILGTVAVLLTSSCSDNIDPEVTSLNADRLFSPINLEARIVNKTSVRLSWTNNAKADSYTIELYAEDSLQFSGTPVQTIPGVTAENLPYVIAGLEGETQYSARVKAVGESITESKWSGVAFKTDAEQIFQNIIPEELTATAVTLHWPAGEMATNITLSPGAINHTVTAEEIAAGAVTITGLTGETSYTAKLMNGTKTRGTITFATLIDLGGAIAVHPEDDLQALVSEANNGDVFALYPGTYNVAAKFTVGKSIAIKAVRPNDKPIIDGYISIEDGAALELKEIVLDGTLSEGSQALVFNTATGFGDLKIDGCEIKNYSKGLIYINVAATIESITINNSIIHDVVCSGGDFIDNRAGAPKVITLTNSTVYNSVSARDFIRVDDKSSSFAGVTPTITVDHCTLNGVANTSNRLLYVRFKGNKITFTNNIVTNTGAIFSNQSSTAAPTFSGNNYFNAPGLFTGGSATSLIFDDSATSLDPGFTDVASGNFKVSQEDIIYKGIGDPRWLK